MRASKRGQFFGMLLGVLLACEHAQSRQFLSLINTASSRVLCMKLMWKAKKQKPEFFPFAPKQEFEADRFQKSTRVEILGYDDKAYALWAIQASPWIVELLKSHDPEVVLLDLRKAYLGFARESGFTRLASSYFRLDPGGGKLEMKIGVRYSSVPSGYTREDWQLQKTLFGLAMKNIEKSFGPISPRQGKFKGKTWWSDLSYHEMSDGSRVAPIVLEFSSNDKEQRLIARSLPAYQAGPVYKDIMKGLRAIQQKSKRPPFKEIARLSRGFFMSAPFTGGTAGIGRVYLGAFFSNVYGRAVVLPADIDLHALTLTAEDFAEWLERQLADQLEGRLLH